MVLCADHPYNHVVYAISGGGIRSTATATSPGHIPSAGDRRRIRWGDAKSREDGVAIVVGTKRDIGVLFGPIGDGRLEDRAAGNLRHSYGRTDSAEIVSINQIRIAVFTQCNHQVRRRCVRYVDQQWA